MKTILIPVSCRSDFGLSAPVIRRLRNEDWCKVKVTAFPPQFFGEAYQKAHWLFRNNKYDLVFITGDRVEMCGVAAAAFHHGIKIAHNGAGIANNVATFDDIDRHCITLWSDIQFCENEGAANKVKELFTGIKYPNCHVIGITHLDDLEVDEHMVPGVPYTLVLYNSPTIGEKEELPVLDKPGYYVLIGGNPDGTEFHKLIDICNEYHHNLSRPAFLGLLKNCQQFITNSSCAVYEAPYFLKPEQIVRIGNRNRKRPDVECVPGGSDKIVSILREYLK